MFQIFITLLFSLTIVYTVVYVLSKVRTPSYRLSHADVVRLLQQVVDGQASLDDWHVFVHIPARHDPELERVRRRCRDIEERHFKGRGAVAADPHFLTRDGVAEVAEVLASLKTQ